VPSHIMPLEGRFVGRVRRRALTQSTYWMTMPPPCFGPRTWHLDKAYCGAEINLTYWSTLSAPAVCEQTGDCKSLRLIATVIGDPQLALRDLFSLVMLDSVAETHFPAECYLPISSSREGRPFEKSPGLLISLLITFILSRRLLPLF
jgi:hypothetical protein